MTPRQVGAVLNVDPETLRRWARKGEGPPFLQGAGYTRRYSRSGLAEWIATRYSPAKEASRVIAKLKGDRAS